MSLCQCSGLSLGHSDAFTQSPKPEPCLLLLIPNGYYSRGVFRCCPFVLLRGNSFVKRGPTIRIPAQRSIPVHAAETRTGSPFPDPWLHSHTQRFAQGLSRHSVKVFLGHPGVHTVRSQREARGNQSPRAPRAFSLGFPICHKQRSSSALTCHPLPRCISSGYMYYCR